jgi:predicted MFS family arabinose efflux permease
MTTSTFLPVGLLTDLAAEFGVSIGTAGLMVMCPGLSAAVAAPVLVVAAGRIERRFLLLVLTGLLIASNTTVALAPNFAVALLGRVMLGVCTGGVWTFASAMSRRLVPATSANRAMAVILAGISVGTICGLPAGTLLGNFAGWRTAFAITALLGTIAAVAQIIFLPRLKTEEAIRPSHFISLLRIPKARVGIIAVTVLTTGHFTAYTYLKPFLTTVSEMDKNMVAEALVIYGAAGFVGTFAGASAISRSLLGAYIAIAVLLGSVVISAPLVGSYKPAALLLVFTWGLAFGAVPICSQVWMFKAAPTAFEGGLALFVSTTQLAVAIGSIIGGILVDHYGTYGAMIAGGCVSLSVAPFLLRFGR